MKNPTISIIMSTYNEQENYLCEAIESILAQSYDDFEFLIVLDNPENDMIRHVVQQYAKQDGRIKIITNDVNIGLTNSLNRALEYAKGQFISRMDADDRMQSDCLAKELEIITTENLDLVSASKVNMDEQGKIKDQYISSISPEQVALLLPYDNMVNHPTVLVRKESLIKENGYRNIPSCEDYDLWIRMLCHGCRMKIIPNVFLYKRMRADGICESNAYQLYISKKFVKKLYKTYMANDKKILSEQDYGNYLRKQSSTELKKQKFNEAYVQLYKAIDYKKQGENRLFCTTIVKAILLDDKILGILLDKITYQIRKKMVLKLVRKE